jgi:hypothetical protein
MEAIFGQKKERKEFQLYLFFIFSVNRTLERYPDSLKKLDPEPYPDSDSMSPYPKLC